MDSLKQKITGAFDQQARSFTTGALTAKAVATGFSLVGQAARKVAQFVGDATKAFIEDEASQAKLRTSVRANAAAYGDNLDAIESVLEARMKLGFSDDEQRKSLSELVGAYGDVDQALAVHRTAMDLARYSGVDLATATDTLIKVHAGNYRALKTLGITTKGITTETQALAAVQRIASGQAEDYTATLEGKLAVAAVKTDEAMEHLGLTTAELSADWDTFFADAVEKAAFGLDYLADKNNFNSQTLERQIEILRIHASLVGGSAAAEDELRIAAIKVAIANRDATVSTTGFGKAALAAEGALGDAADATDDFSAAALKANKRTAPYVTTLERLEEIADKLPDALDRVTEALFGGAQLTGDLAEARGELAALMETEPAKGTRAWKIWAGDVAAAKQSIFELQFQMAQSEGPDALLEFLRKQRKALGEADSAARTYIDSLIVLAKREKVIAGGGFARLQATPTGSHRGARASGGPVAPRGAYTVGERGPETLVMGDQGGTIVPHGAAVVPHGAQMAAGPLVVQVTIAGGGPWTPGMTDELGRNLGPVITRWQQQRGHLPAARVF